MLQVGAKPPQRFQPLGRGLYDLGLGLEDLAAVLFHQHAEHFPHPPAGRTDHLQAKRRGPQQRDAAIANHTNGIGIAFEGLQLKSGEMVQVLNYSQINPLGYYLVFPEENKNNKLLNKFRIWIKSKMINEYTLQPLQQVETT